MANVIGWLLFSIFNLAATIALNWTGVSGLWMDFAFMGTIVGALMLLVSLGEWIFFDRPETSGDSLQENDDG